MTSHTEPSNPNLGDALNTVVIGSGPAGWTAAIYLARNQLDPVVITGNQLGGQLTITNTIENFPGFENPIGGSELMERMHKQALVCGARVVNDHVEEVDFSKAPFVLRTRAGKEFKARTVIIATGSYAKWLGLESESRFQGYGVSGCAICDGFFFKGQKVAVVGGGNTAIEEALHLSKLAKEVVLLVRSGNLKGEAVMRDLIRAQPNIQIRYNTQVIEVLGLDDSSGKRVTGVRVQEGSFPGDDAGSVYDLDVNGLFIAIGHNPNSEIFRGKIDVDPFGYIITAPGSTCTSVPGVFAAGDVQDPKFKQAVVSAGTGCMAALEASDYLEGNL